MLEAKEIRPGLYTDGVITWRRNNEGQTTHPETKELVHYGCGHVILEQCHCIGHEGTTSDAEGSSHCPACWEEHRSTVRHVTTREIEEATGIRFMLGGWARTAVGREHISAVAPRWGFRQCECGKFLRPAWAERSLQRDQRDERLAAGGRGSGNEWGGQGNRATEAAGEPPCPSGPAVENGTRLPDDTFA